MKNLVIALAENDFNPNMVSINYDAILNYLFDQTKQYFFFQKKENIPFDNFKDNIDYTLGLNSINYQYWSYPNDKLQRYIYKEKIGAEAALIGFNDIKRKIDSKLISSELINENDITHFFGEIPDKKGRVVNLRESMNKYNLDEVYSILNDDAKNKLIDVNTAYKISQIMPKSFSDPYLKKIQLALFDIAELLKIKYPRLEIDLTVAADYQLPKVLQAMGVLNYNDNITRKINLLILIPEDSPEEKAIRAATILACEKICSIHNIYIPYIDKLLWDYRKDFGNIKFHLTKTKRY